MVKPENMNSRCGERRVVITAASAMTPIGSTREKILESLMAGRSGVRSLDTGGNAILDRVIKTRVFGEVTDKPEIDFPRKFMKTMGPVAMYSCHTAGEALEQSGLDEAFIRSGRMGIAYGSTQGSPIVQLDLYRNLLNEDFSYANIPSSGYIQQMTHTTAVNIAQMFGITGRVISSCTACTTSSHSIGYGYESIKYGMQDAMLCGGADEYDLLTVVVFDKLLAASTRFNDTPELTPRPFDNGRDGLVVAEGAGTVILEEYEHARSRGAEILGEVIGFSCENNGGNLIHPNVQGIARTLRSGLASARINPEDVDFISAHATATPVGDQIEAGAIHLVYGDNPLVSGMKSYTGHTIGACGVIETCFALLMMQKGLVFPTLHLEDVDEKCAMLNHTPGIVERDLNVISIQNFAFGGVNTALFLKKV